MIKRLLFAVFFLCGGFLFVIPYWIIFGTAASRQRKRLIKLMETRNAN